jgi:hypothetical protein
MAENVLVDAAFLVALLNRRDGDHGWAETEATRFPPPWKSCNGQDASNGPIADIFTVLKTAVRRLRRGRRAFSRRELP